ncbi:MAG: protein kinase domain-containing protein [Carbonactinosporaceae bacterium]
MTVGSWRRGDVVLDLYEVLGVLDSGGMGLVYRVRHPGWNMDLAMKVPRHELVATADGRDGFEAEAGTWVELGLHANVVNCAYVRRVEGTPCVFAEWVDGASLAQCVRDGQLHGDDGASPARALDMAVQIAWGIDHAHQQGVIHQDIKPSNIMIDMDADWTAKVTDFGLAGARVAAGESATVPPGASLEASYGGMTPAYCSPEQADAVAGAQVTLTRATDVWSWALCVLEMFAGAPPCRYGQTAPEIFPALLESQPVSGGHAIPTALADLLWRCFEIDPALRPHRLDELAAAVTEIYADVVGSAYPRVPPQSPGLLADGLSNRALSLLDLERADESEELWRMAMDVDPHHPPTLYNWALYRWRQGHISDDQAVSELRTARTVQGDRWQGDHLLGLVHVERGDDEAARELLATAAEVAEVEAARGELAHRPRSMKPVWLPGHPGGVTALAVDATGTVAMSGGRDGRIRVWAPAENRCRYELPEASGTTEPSRARAARKSSEGDGTSAAVTAVAVSGDGSTGLTVYDEGPVEMWDLTRGTRISVLTGHISTVTAVALNNSRIVALAYDTGMVQVRDLSTGRLLAELDHPPATFQRLDPKTGRVRPEIHHRPAQVSALAVSEDGSRVVSAAPRDGSLVVWDVDGEGPLHELVMSADRHTTGIDRVALSPDGTYALLAGFLMDRTHIWETRTDRTRDGVPALRSEHFPAALNDDATVAVSAGDGPLRVWETRAGRCLLTIDTQSDQEVAWDHRCVALSGDGRVAAVSHAYGGIQFHHLPRTGFRAGWSYARPQPVATLEESEARVQRMFERADALAERGETSLAAGELRAARAVSGFERHPRLRELWAQLGRAAGRPTNLLGVWQRYDLSGAWIFTELVSLALSADGELAVTGGADGRVRVWEVQTGQCLHTFVERVAKTHTVLLARDGRLALTADWAGTAHLWNLETRTRGCQLYGDHGQVKSVSVDEDCQYALVGDDDGALCLWNLRPSQGRPYKIRTMLTHDGPVGRVLLSGDGKHAASAPSGYGKRVGKLWRVATGRPLLDIPLDVGPATLRFSPDGRRLFVSNGGRVTAWDVRTCWQLYATETYYGDALAISADGRIGVTRGLGTLRVWETDTGRVVRELPEHTDVFDVSPEGRHVLAADTDEGLRMWDVRTGQCVHTLGSQPEGASWVRFSADGRNVLAADLRPALQLWEMDWDYDFSAKADVP